MYSASCHRLAGCLAVAALSLAVGIRSYAALILDPNASSIIEATAGIVPQPDDHTITITTVPFVGTASAAQAGDTSSVAGNLSNSGMVFVLTQNNPGTATNSFSETIGLSDINFSVSVDTPFTLTANFITGPQPVDFGVPVGLLSELDDLSAESGNQTIYSNSASGNAGDTLTLPDGSGTLLAGHRYEFFFEADINALSDPFGTGNVALNFAPTIGPGPGVPLIPAAWGALLAIGAVIVIIERRGKTWKAPA
jgi:hypothetical protein